MVKQMRVTLSEIYQSQMFVGIGALEIGAGGGAWHGYPMPLWTSYVLLATGIALPLLAWYLRRPGQTPEIDKS